MGVCGRLVVVLVVLTVPVAIFLGTFKIPPGTTPAAYAKTVLGCAYMKTVGWVDYFGYGKQVLILRDHFNAIKTPTPPGVKTQDVLFGGIPVRVYTPDVATESGPGVAYMHGGGWVMGTLDQYNYLVGDLAVQSGMVYVSIDYRRAPEHTFPVPFEDCVTATEYFLDHAEELGVNPARVAVAGDSAGGNLAAAVTLKLRSRIKTQVLIYPVLQPFNFNTPSYQITGPKSAQLTKAMVVSCWLYYAQGHINNLDAAMVNNHTPAVLKDYMAAYHINVHSLGKQYIPEHYVKSRTDFGDDALWKELQGVFMNPYFSPLAAQSLKGLPRTHVLTAEYDVLRDDGVLYVRRLEQAGVKVTHYHSWEGTHGMLTDLGREHSTTAAEMFSSMVTFLKRVL